VRNYGKIIIKSTENGTITGKIDLSQQTCTSISLSRKSFQLSWLS